MNLTVRDANLNDLARIVAFNSRMARETEGKSLDETLISAGAAALLGSQDKGRYWVAEGEDGVIGQIMVTYEWSDWRNGVLWWIQSVYVHENHRRQGVFSALYRHVESLAMSDDGVRGIRLYVEQENLRAQSTYRSLGMESTGYQVMESVFRDGNRD